MSDSDPMDFSLPVSSVHGILQARLFEWLPFSSLGVLPKPMSLTSPALTGRFFTTSATWEAQTDQGRIHRNHGRGAAGLNVKGEQGFLMHGLCSDTAWI